MAVAWVSCAAVAEAQGPVALAWDAPAECPAIGAARDWLSVVVPEEVLASLEGAEASIRIVREAASFRASVSVELGAFHGERVIEGARCEDVARSAVLVVSLALVEAAHAGEPEPPSEEIPAALPPSPPPVLPDRPSPGTPPSPRDLTFEVSAGATSGFGPPLAPRLDVALRATRPHFSFGGRLLSMPYTWAPDRNDTPRARLVSLALAPEGCARRDHGAVSWDMCVRVGVGFVAARGAAVETRLRDLGPLVDVALRPVLAFGRGRVRVLLAGEVQSRLVRPVLAVDGLGRFERFPIAAGAVTLGVATTFSR